VTGLARESLPNFCRSCDALVAARFVRPAHALDVLPRWYRATACPSCGTQLSGNAAPWCVVVIAGVLLLFAALAWP